MQQTINKLQYTINGLSYEVDLPPEEHKFSSEFSLSLCVYKTA